MIIFEDEKTKLRKKLENYAYIKCFFFNKTIENTVIDLVDFRDSEDYIEKIVYLDESDNEKSNYSFIKKELRVRFTKESNNAIESNIYNISALLHEFAHVEQFKVCVNLAKNVDIKKIILEESLAASLFFENYNKIIEGEKNISLLEREKINTDYAHYLKRCDIESVLYNKKPSERMANIASYTEVIDILKVSKRRTLNSFVSTYEEKLQESLLSGYDPNNLENTSPTFDFYDSLLNLVTEKQDEIILHKNILKSLWKNLPALERLYLGLPLTEPEYDNLLVRKKHQTNLLF